MTLDGRPDEDRAPSVDRRTWEYVFRTAIVACAATLVTQQVRLAVLETTVKRLPPAGLLEDVREIKVDVREIRQAQQDHLRGHSSK
jgi:hypothetical protein